MLQELLEVLSPLEAAIFEFSKNSATLLTTESVFKFIFEKLEEMNSDLSKRFLKQIKQSMDERRDKVLMTLLNLLKTGNVPRSTKYFDNINRSTS